MGWDGCILQQFGRILLELFVLTRLLELHRAVGATLTEIVVEIGNKFGMRFDGDSNFAQLLLTKGSPVTSCLISVTVGILLLIVAKGQIGANIDVYLRRRIRAFADSMGPSLAEGPWIHERGLSSVCVTNLVEYSRSTDVIQRCC